MLTQTLASKKTLWRIRQRLLPNLGVAEPNEDGQHSIFLLKDNALLAKLELDALQLTSYLWLYPDDDTCIEPFNALDRLVDTFYFEPDPKWEKRGYTLLTDEAWHVNHLSEAPILIGRPFDFFLPIRKSCTSLEEVVQETYQLLEDNRFYLLDCEVD